MHINITPGYDDVPSVKILFDEYTQLLADVCDKFYVYLNIQGYDSELENLGTKYGLPCGRLYIAYAEGQAAGCIALRKLDESSCEMKRLYVRPEHRGAGIARQLVDIIIRDAKDIGYRHMLLDTLPALKAALQLYEDLGFYRIAPYNDSPVDDTIFMRLDL